MTIEYIGVNVDFREIEKSIISAGDAILLLKNGQSEEK
jgi:hypothetical protein